ncbi:MAG: hypothetical protein V9H69_03275 [Anaerolineae bacterium]
MRLAPTLFTDPWLTLWMLLSLWAALAGRSWLAGIACGLAFATKQQGLLLAPLLVAAFLGALRQPAQPLPASRRRLIWRWCNGFALIAVAVLWWDSLRWQWMPSFWERSAAELRRRRPGAGCQPLAAAGAVGRAAGHGPGLAALAGAGRRCSGAHCWFIAVGQPSARPPSAGSTGCCWPSSPPICCCTWPLTWPPGIATCCP